MSSFTTAAPSTEATRRVLSERQARTVHRLTEATLEELRDVGYEQLTVRNVARRAGVAPATAYTYFASKEHLVTEVFWRLLDALPDPRVDGRRCPSDRVAEALEGFTTLAEKEPSLMSACTFAMVADDPDVRHLRDRIGAAIHRRLVAALGEDADPMVVEALDLALAGAMIWAGTGHLSYSDVSGRIAGVARLLLERRA